MREKDDDDVDDDDDWENPDPDDEGYGDDDDDSAVYVCPECGAAVYEDAEQCPSCRQYITPKSQSIFAPRSRWMIWAAILALIGVAGAYLFLLR